MFFNYPSISSLFKHLGMYVCISLYHWPHLAGVIVPMFLCRVWSSKWVRKLPNAIPCRRAFSLLFICSCCSGRHMSAFMAAFPGPNSELKKLPPYSPFLNIVEQAISALKSSHKSGHKSSRAARTDEQQRKGTTTRNRVRQFPHSFATSHPAEKHWHYHAC